MPEGKNNTHLLQRSSTLRWPLRLIRGDRGGRARHRAAWSVAASAGTQAPLSCGLFRCIIVQFGNIQGF